MAVAAASAWPARWPLSFGQVRGQRGQRLGAVAIARDGGGGGQGLGQQAFGQVGSQSGQRPGAGAVVVGDGGGKGQGLGQQVFG